MGKVGVRSWWERSLTDIVLLVFMMVCCYGQQQQRLYFKRQDKCPKQVLKEDLCPDMVKTKGKSQCGAECGQRAGCLSFVWDPDTLACRLCNSTVNVQCNNTRSHDRQQTFELRCQDDQERTSALCQCPPAWDGPLCQNRMTDCVDWRKAGHTGTDVKWIYPTFSPRPFRILCENKHNRGMVLRRKTTKLDLYRNWTEYVEGFGQMLGDHWLGLRQVQLLTQSRCYKLGMQVNLVNNTFYLRYYRHFTLSPESHNFTFDFNFTTAWTNSPLGDCLTAVKQRPFSTYDADHDTDPAGNCAERHHSGWWFGNCTLCNPTGILTQEAGRSPTETEVFLTPGLEGISPRSVIMFLQRC